MEGWEVEYNYKWKDIDFDVDARIHLTKLLVLFFLTVNPPLREDS
jgi:hypothetical protein